MGMSRTVLKAFDISVRVSLLESVTGMRPGAWPRTPRGLEMARADIGDSIHPAWYSPTEQGVASTVYQRARALLPPEDAEDLTVDILSGFTSTDARGFAEYAGTKMLNRVFNPKMTPEQSVAGLFHAHTTSRARDLLKKRERRRDFREEDVTEVDTVSQTELLDRPEAFLVDNPLLARWIQSTLDRWPIQSAKTREISKAYFEDPSYGALTAIADDYGVSKQAIRKHVKKALAYLTEMAQKDPRTIRLLQLDKDLNSRMASRVASKWLVVEWLKGLGRML